MPEDFPPMTFLGPENQPGVAFAANRELSPLFARPPHPLWAQCFRAACSRAPEIDWRSAGYAVCTQDQVTEVTDALREASAEADRHLVAYLRTIAPNVAADIVGAERSAAAHAADDGPYRLPLA